MRKYEYFERFENWKNHHGATVVKNNDTDNWEVWEDKDGLLTGKKSLSLRSHEEAASAAEEMARG